MIPWIVGLVVAAIAGGISFGAVCVMLRDRHIRLTLGIPDGVNGELGELRAKLMVQTLVDTEMKIQAAVPRLNPQQRRKLALALVRTRGLLPRQDPDGR